MSLRDFLSKPSTYAGIGSRETPPDVLALMTHIARKLDAMGWTLRSGGADGADTAFENGATWKEIFLPWRGFNGRHSGYRLERPTIQAYNIAPDYHPAWLSFGKAIRALLARNTHQVLGADCKSPSAFVLCWTPDGSTGITTARTGGTGQAIRIAHAYGILIFNLARADHRKEWEELVNG